MPKWKGIVGFFPALIIAAVASGGGRAGERPPLATPTPRLDTFGDPLPDGAVLRLGTTRLRHAHVFAFAFDPEGRLVSFGRDYVLRTWDPASGKQLHERAVEKD